MIIKRKLTKGNGFYLSCFFGFPCFARNDIWEYKYSPLSGFAALPRLGENLSLAFAPLIPPSEGVVRQHRGRFQTTILFNLPPPLCGYSPQGEN
jgi:hypothetical protein